MSKKRRIPDGGTDRTRSRERAVGERARRVGSCRSPSTASLRHRGPALGHAGRAAPGEPQIAAAPAIADHPLRRGRDLGSAALARAVGLTASPGGASGGKPRASPNSAASDHAGADQLEPDRQAHRTARTGSRPRAGRPRKRAGVRIGHIETGSARRSPSAEGHSRLLWGARPAHRKPAPRARPVALDQRPDLLGLEAVGVVVAGRQGVVPEHGLRLTSAPKP